MNGHNGEIAALVIEQMVRERGASCSSPRIFKKSTGTCTRYKTFMIADEVAVGFGKTGKMFACEHEKVTPDIMALAKGISEAICHWRQRSLQKNL